MRHLWVVVAFLCVGCGPRLGIRREVPPRADLSGAQLVAVVDGQATSVFNVGSEPWENLARNELVPSAVRRVEAAIGRTGKFQLVPGCYEDCPQADAVIRVAVSNVKVDPGNQKKEEAKQASITLEVKAVRRDGRHIYSGTYWGSQSGGVPGTKNEVPDHRLLHRCVELATEDFVRDLFPRWIDESFRLEDEGPLKPIVELTARGDLDGAEALVRQVLAQTPQNAKAIYDLGVVFTARGRLEEARDAFKAAAALDKKYNWYLNEAQQRIDDRATLQREGQ